MGSRDHVVSGLRRPLDLPDGWRFKLLLSGVSSWQTPKRKGRSVPESLPQGRSNTCFSLGRQVNEAFIFAE